MVHIAYLDPDETGRFTFEQIAVLLRARDIPNEVHFYPTLDDARREMPADRPHIAFIDVRAQGDTPSNNALALIRELRQYPLCRHTVIVGMARYAMPADETASRIAGCDEFLPKPIRYQAVENLLVEHLVHRVP